jgi:uncharacterized protein YeaO (DUF488 family)
VAVRLKRVYDPPDADDGIRILVDRLWPRGLSKEKARIDHWARELAPSDDLRRWYNHEPARWPEFQSRYAAELRAQPEAVAELRRRTLHGTVTFLFSSRETQKNNAAALKRLIDGG